MVKENTGEKLPVLIVGFDWGKAECKIIKRNIYGIFCIKFVFTDIFLDM